MSQYKLRKNHQHRTTSQYKLRRNTNTELSQYKLRRNTNTELLSHINYVRTPTQNYESI